MSILSCSWQYLLTFPVDECPKTVEGKQLEIAQFGRVLGLGFHGDGNGTFIYAREGNTGKEKLSRIQ